MDWIPLDHDLENLFGQLQVAQHLPSKFGLQERPHVWV